MEMLPAPRNEAAAVKIIKIIWLKVKPMVLEKINKLQFLMVGVKTAKVSFGKNFNFITLGS